MEFLKRHYEKILLSLVLLGLGGAAAWLPIALREAKSELQREVVVPKDKPPASLDLSKAQAQLERLKNPPVIVLSGDHNLFNPLTWKRTASNELKSFRFEGPAALTITNVHELYTVITYKKAAGTGYDMGLQLQSIKKPDLYLKVNEAAKQSLFIIREAKGAAEDPGELVIEILESQQKVSIKKGESFQRVDGYAVDLRYDPDSKKFDGRRVGQFITFAGETYKIIDITKNTVTVQANSTGKKTTIMWNGTPNP